MAPEDTFRKTEKLEEAKYNVAKRAEVTLDYVLEHERDEATSETVAESLQAEPVLKNETARDTVRLLYITADPDVLDATSPFYVLWNKLAPLFAEVHILCVAPEVKQDKIDRVADNIWRYRVARSSARSRRRAGVKMAATQLVFGDAFRPDIIIATDTGCAGAIGVSLSRTYNRPLQLHLREAHLRQPRSFLGRWLASRVLCRATSVMLDTEALETRINKQCTGVTILRFPEYYQVNEYLADSPHFDVHERYDMYTFIAVTRADLVADSELHDVIGAMLPLFRNPRFGLLILGDGPAKSLFEKKVSLLGITKQVIFQSEATADVLSIVSSADLYVDLRPEERYDMSIVQVAAAGTPIVTVENPFRMDFFTHGESAYVCPVGDLECVATALRELINQNSTRVRLAHNARQLVKDRVHENAQSYLQTYRSRIESALATHKE